MLVSFAHVAMLYSTVLTAAAELRLAEMHGPGLAQFGATSVVSSDAYNGAQPCLRAIYDHPSAVDGIVYRSKHGDGELRVALFERCRERLQVGSASALAGDCDRFAGLLDRYGVGLSWPWRTR